MLMSAKKQCLKWDPMSLEEAGKDSGQIRALIQRRDHLCREEDRLSLEETESKVRVIHQDHSRNIT